RAAKGEWRRQGEWRRRLLPAQGLPRGGEVARDLRVLRADLRGALEIAHRLAQGAELGIAGAHAHQIDVAAGRVAQRIAIFLKRVEHVAVVERAFRLAGDGIDRERPVDVLFGDVARADLPRDGAEQLGGLRVGAGAGDADFLVAALDHGLEQL